jgi:hypothetical protein
MRLSASRGVWTYRRSTDFPGTICGGAPEDYLRWIIEGQNDLREELKASARYWLDRRNLNGPRLPGL